MPAIIESLNHLNQWIIPSFQIKLFSMSTELPNPRIVELANFVGQTVQLSGWVYNRRSSGKIQFLQLRDGSGFVQCILENKPETAEAFQLADTLGQEASVRLTGLVRADPRSPGGVEVAATGLTLIGQSEGFPITPKPHGIEFLMQHRHLWFRSRRQWAILRVRSTLVDAIQRFFNDRGFVRMDTPIFAPSAGEGAQTLFEVDYFGEQVYLAQTGQLYLEAAAMSHGRVYCFGPTFRAEKSKTRRHLTEFWMVEPEMAFCDLLGDMAVAEEFVRFIVKACVDKHPEELTLLGRDLSKLEPVCAGKPFARITYNQAHDLLHAPKIQDDFAALLANRQERLSQLQKTIAEAETKLAGGNVKKWEQDKLAATITEAKEELADVEEDVRNLPRHAELARNFKWGEDLGGSDETIISRQHDVPTFVTHYPREVKAFYMKRNEADHRLVNNFDLLAPEGYGEVIGGSQREDDLDVLLERMAHEGLKTEDYEWYLDLRRYGSVPHAGFGLGVERTLAWICGLKHVRETIPYPRMMGKFWP